jgi:hypothetical protein
MVELVEPVHLVVLVGVVALQVAQVHLDKGFLVELILILVLLLRRGWAVEEGRVQPVHLVGMVRLFLVVLFLFYNIMVVMEVMEFSVLLPD